MLPVETARLRLRDFARDDVEAVHRYAADPVVTRHLSWGPNTEAETRAFLRVASAEPATRPRRNYQLAVIERASGTLIGGCGLVLARERPREYELGYTLHRDWWGRGLGGEIVGALVDLGLGALAARRLHALVEPANVASVRLLERHGFRLVAHVDAGLAVRPACRDALLYVLGADDVARRGP